MLLTEEQLKEIRQIIADHHSAFVANTVSPTAVAADVLDRLKQKGLYQPKIESVRDAYLYGQVLAAIENPRVASMTYEEFKKWVKVNPIPLTEIERQAIMVAQQQAGQYAVGLGNRIDQQTGQTLIEADHVLRQQLRDQIQTATAENIARRETVKQLKSDLGWATKDWARDWDRIAVTEKHNAMQHGVADHIAGRYGSDALVAKRPMPDCCAHCYRLYIGPDGQPRIFKLSTLMGNGTNFRVKTGAWKPTIGPLHPNCQCQLIRIPQGYGFDETGRLVPGGGLGVHYEDEAELEASLSEEDELRKSGQVAGALQFQGLQIAVENPAGSVRRWTNPQGKSGETKMLYPYGYIEGTRGQDDEEVDCFVGPDPRAPEVYVVHQQNPATKQYDETKCMLGFRSAKEAEQVFRRHYDRPDFQLWIDTMPVDAFRRWLQKSAPAPRSERFVLRKAGGEFTGTTSATLSERAFSPGYGTGVNFAVGSRRTPVKSDPKLLTPQPREILEDEDRFVPDSLRRDLDVYTVDPEPPRIVRHFDVPEEWSLDLKKLRKKSAAENHPLVDTEAQRDKAVVRNTVEPEDSKPLEKSHEPGAISRKRVTRVAAIRRASR